MGNACVAAGGTPHRADITVVNDTNFPLQLDQSVGCNRECQCKGWQVTEGKIVEGCQPPDEIPAFSKGLFSVSGRDSSAVAPEGKVFYRNEALKLDVTLSFTKTGWASKHNSAASMTVNGKPDAKDSWIRVIKKEPKRWSEVLATDVNVDTWTFTLRPRETGEDWMKMVRAIGDAKIKVGF
eukprot:GFUD01002140.1.p1 GENE.GFUD01002140.1~~GFUD01002140.1.p1  ORF type:complete len:181 (-),score=31.51 GFUD01002140.1:44-586(-)